MDTAQIDKSIDKILWGKCLVDVENQSGNASTFILRSLSIKETNYVNYIYDREYETAISQGVLEVEDLEELYKSCGVWTEENDQYIENLQVKIEALKDHILANEFMVGKQKKLKRQLKKAKEELSSVLSEREKLFYVSAENRAEEIKRRYVVMLSTETIQEEPFWPSEEFFMAELDQRLIYNLAIAYLKNTYFTVEDLRKIARAPSWRYRWAASKNGENLYGKPISEWSEMQNMLVYWSQFYDSVFESPDRPLQSVIDDDDACDAWMEEQSKKYDKSATANSTAKSKTAKSKTNKFHQEQFIMVDGEGESIKKVHDLNSDSVREKLKYKFDRIKKEDKRIKEWDMERGWQK